MYYREETHYLVMTAKKDSLFRKNVIKSLECVDLLSCENVDNESLKKFVREVADYIKLPSNCEFMKSPQNKEDISIFDFSKYA